MILSARVRKQALALSAGLYTLKYVFFLVNFVLFPFPVLKIFAQYPKPLTGFLVRWDISTFVPGKINDGSNITQCEDSTRNWKESN